MCDESSESWRHVLLQVDVWMCASLWRHVLLQVDARRSRQQHALHAVPVVLPAAARWRPHQRQRGHSVHWSVVFNRTPLLLSKRASVSHLWAHLLARVLVSPVFVTVSVTAEPKHHPLLCTLPLLFDQPDLMDVLRVKVPRTLFCALFYVDCIDWRLQYFADSHEFQTALHELVNLSSIEMAKLFLNGSFSCVTLVSRDVSCCLLFQTAWAEKVKSAKRSDKVLHSAAWDIHIRMVTLVSLGSRNTLFSAFLEFPFICINVWIIDLQGFRRFSLVAVEVNSGALWHYYVLVWI